MGIYKFICLFIAFSSFCALAVDPPKSKIANDKNESRDRPNSSGDAGSAPEKASKAKKFVQENLTNSDDGKIDTEKADGQMVTEKKFKLLQESGCAELAENTDENGNNPAFDNCIKEKMKDPAFAKKLAEIEGSSGDADDPTKIGTNISFGSSKEGKKLEQYLIKRLHEALYGKGKEGHLVEHTVFYDLYRSQLGKVVVRSTMSYCYDSNLSSGGVIGLIKSKEAVETNNKNNIELLKIQENGEPKAAKAINRCIFNIRFICHCKELSSKEKLKKDFEATGIGSCSSIEIGSKDPLTDQYYPIERACATLSKIKQLRETMLANDKIKDQMDEYAKSSASSFGFNLGKQVGGGGYGGSVSVQTKNGPKSVSADLTVSRGGGGKGVQVKNDLDQDKVTDISTTELLGTDGADIEGEQKKLAEKFDQECKSADPDECDALFHKRSEKDFKKAAAEHRLQTLAAEAKIDQMDETKLKAYFKAKGKADKEIEELLKKDVAQIKEEIKAKFKKERMGILASIRDEMEKSGQQKAKVFKKDQSSKLLSKTERMRDLVHFTNVVSGYFKVSGSDGKKSQNLKILKRELENAKDSKYFKGQTYLDSLTKSMQGKESNSSGSVYLKPDLISKIVGEGGSMIKELKKGDQTQ